MKDKSIRKLTKKECRMLSEAMGFGESSLTHFEGRYVKIILKSPRRVKGCCGQVYRND